MHRKFDVRRIFTAFFVGVFAVVGTLVAIDTPASAAIPPDILSSPVDNYAALNGTNQGFGRTGVSFGAHGSNFTVEMWLNPSSISGTSTVYGKQDSFAMTLVNGVVTCRMKSTAGGNWLAAVSTGKALVVNQWQHIAFVKAGNVATLYVNGQMLWTVTDAGKLPAAGLLDNTTYVGIGANNYDGTANQSVPAGSYFSGGMDEVKIWNSARTQTQIETGMHSKLATPATDLLAYWDFNGSISPLYDYSANGLDLTAANAPVITDVKTTTKVSGKTVLTFPRSYLTNTIGWTVPSGVTRADALAIGGGGGGASRHAGGGGAGEVGSFSGLSLTPAGVLQIKVGAGGAGFDDPTNNTASSGKPGQSSILGAYEFLGGGGGQGGTGSVSNGGSSGGTAGSTIAVGSALNGSGTTGSLTRYVSAGTRGNYGSEYFGGGGGGATGAGTAATASAPGAGGQGFSSSITGTAKCYAAGGGGGATTGSGGAAGTCINGAATTATPGTFNTAAAAASANSGSGGGAGGLNGSDDQPSGAGGSGIVIIAYAPVDDNYMNFNGTSQYAVASGAQVIPATGAFTVEAWVNPLSKVTGTPLVIAAQGASSSNYFFVKIQNGKLSVGRTTSGISNCGSVNNGEWTHVAVAVNGANVNCFLNGQATASSSSFNTDSIGTGFYSGINSVTAWGEYFKGGVDQIKVWNSALGASAVARSMHAYADQDSSGYILGSAASPALTNLYPFNEATGTASVADMVGSANLITTDSPTSTSIVTSSTSASTTLYTIPRTVLNAFGGWVSPLTSTSAQALVVAGGGGAGKTNTINTSPVAGSGGGGGVQTLTAQSLSAGAVYPAKIGAGGQGATTIADDASTRNGQSSTFLSNPVLGGGGGGSANNPGAGGESVATGGGGGGVANYTCANYTNRGGTVTSGFGLNGGQGIQSWGGAGGGAGGASPALICSQEFGTSGPGLISSISGAAVEYGRGGYAGLNSNIPASNSNPGSGGSAKYGASTGNGEGYSGKNGVIFVSIKTANAVTFNGNGGTSTLAVQNIGVGTAANLSTASGTVTRTGYTFTGWNTQANNYGTPYADSVSLDPGNDITLYAQWIPNAPVLYYNFSDRDSTHGGTTTVTNLADTATLAGSKINAPTHNYTNGTLNLTGTTYANGSYVDVADVATAQFGSGITVDFEVDFGSSVENGERVLDFGVSGQATSNILVSRRAASSDIVFEIYNGSTSQGHCYVVGGIPASAQMIRWTFSLDGTNCYVWKDGVAQVTTTTSVANSYATVQTSAFAYLPANNVTWASNFIGKSNWSADAAAKMAVRSLRIYAGAMTADQVGSISYRTVNFDGNYTGSAAIESRYTSGKTTLQDGPNRSGFTFGGWYDNAVSASGTLIGSSGAVYSPVSTPMNLYASWTSAMPSVNVQFDELNFDYSNVVHIVGTNGKALNNKVLFLNVTTKGGVQVDALVTTQTLSNATIANYEASTGAGGANSYFQADVDISAANGFAEFKFDFYQHGAAGSAGNPCAPTTNTTCVGATKVKLQNVNISAIDIDYYQWNDFTAVESYTVAGNSQTKLKECEIPGTGTCAARTAPATFPANMRFQGSADTARTNDPVDMAIVTYAEIETFRIKFGRSATGKPNYYGVAFKALPWGVQTPASVGGTTYGVNYNGNGSTVGNNPTSSTGVVGSNVTLPGAGTLTKTGYSFAGWNTLADGTGTTYAAGNVIQMPQGGTTLYAKWTAIQYMLIYKLYGGVNGPATEMRYTGAVANLSAIQPVRDGNYFHSWNTLADGTGTTYAPSDSFTMPGANTTLHAMWGVATGTVAYNANNGSNAPASTSGTSGANATAAAVGSMTRANYTFSGWNTAANGSGTDYTVGASVPYPGNGQTTTLYAQWTPVLYSYSYNANGGSGAPTGGSTTAGSTVTIASSTTTRTGYTFAGWTTAADGTGTVYSNGGANPSLTMPSSNTVLYAKWTAISYNLSFNSNDAGAGANPATATGTYGSTQNVAAAPSAPTNKKFNGWNTEQNGSGSTYAASSTYQLTADQTLYGQWVADTVNLFYSANGGSGAPTSTTATANVDVTLSGTAPQRTGFEFSGWTTAQNGTGTVYGVSSTFPLGNTDTTLYAKWTPIGYNFIYSANGGSGAPATVAYNMGQFVVINSGGTVERTGYTFAGWNTLADGNGSDYIGGQNFLMSDSNMTMYAKWTSNPYTLTYNGNGGTGSPAPETRNAGAVANLSATAPTRDGYTFNGWNSALNGSGTNYGASASFTMPTSNSTIYAQWVLNSNAVSYNANNGAGAPTGGTYGYAATVTVSNATPTRVGYTFLGWNTQADGNGTNYAAADTFSMPNASVVLYARWAVQQKIFTYDANGGAGVEAAANYNYGATVTVTSSQPTRAGYSFIGWNSMADGSGTASAASSTFTMPASDVTVYAIWSVNAYTVYYNMNGGSGSINPQPGTYGTNVTVSSTSPTRVGFTFSGWNTLPDGTGSDHTGGGSLTIPSNNLTLYAKWTAIQYSISYNANGGSGSPADVTALTAGTNTTLSATAPTRDGYVFNGWNTAVNGSGQTYAGGQSYVVPAANTVLYAQWVANTYEVIYNANGGTGAPAAENGSTGQSVNLSGTSPTRPGYSFVRWNTDISDTNTGTRYAPGGPFSVPAGNTILYAIWDLADITLTYNINGGAGTTPATVTDKFMAAVTLSPASAFSRSGYTFNGWNTAADGSGASYAAESNFVLPDANEELFAQWSQIFYAVEYNTNGGANAPANQFAAPGTNVSIAPTEPTKAGYVFDDWTSAGAGTTVTPGATLTMPSSNVVLVANWVTRATVPSGQTNGGVASPSPSPSGTPSPSATPAPKKLSQTVYFKGDSAVLQPAAKTQLRAVAKKAKAYGTAAKIQVYGRVKETNDKSYDLRLSRARANNVAKYLKSLGVKGVWVITAAGISPENKAISRRVDLYMNWK